MPIFPRLPRRLSPPRLPVPRAATPAAGSPTSRGARLALSAALLAGLSAAGAQSTPRAAPIKIGMSAAFTGASAGLGTEYYRGAKAYFDEVNAGGGVGGRRLQLVALDDAYQPTQAVTNTVQLIEREKVFALFNYVGTPTLTAALPVLKSLGTQQISLIGNLTGAQVQRTLPYSSDVFNIRPSYREEMEAQVEQLWAAGFRKFGVFYQLDAYGRSGTDAVARALAKRGARITAEATYRRGATADADMGAAMRHLREADVEVVLCTGAYQGVAAFIRSARDASWGVPITNLSFVSADNLLELLQASGRQRGRDYTQALFNTQVVPSYADTRYAGVREYRQLMDKWKPQLPATLRDKTYKPAAYSFVGLEGFLNAKVIVHALRASGSPLTQARFRSALERTSKLDLGLAEPVSFSRDRHQGLQQVYLTAVKGGRWVTVDRWNAAP
ncbi:ABC transporter substrate-binding protein [Deinococcus budaensis]|uniref:ABC-type branched-subunit amino acid transport system substrate-binding protein n=1 Tax=Deinococcus budaensis TaxID=1665626 RepID=A0A7W8GG83_9DEIO|nr:ABC transporter substrate-binding protein [Deinococcus budaensis]MBB5234779.1 ABC-type branched-subunit amino acid transport system substrate-binding protein [Deinococcus budaensis]